jgi:thiopurine S-methyltransferase
LDESDWDRFWDQTTAIGREPSPSLTRWWSSVGAPQSLPVLVPLAGDSPDLGWLEQHHGPVFAIERSTVAIKRWLATRAMPSTAASGSPRSWYSGKITMIQADFLSWTDTEIRLGSAYDCGAVIALPARLRMTYAERLATILPAGAPTILVTIEYPQQERRGPPFAVTAEEVDRLFLPSFTVERLGSRPVRLSQETCDGIEDTWLLRRR